MTRPSRSIVLWQPTQSTTTDDACTTIVKSVLSPPCEQGPYEDNGEQQDSVFYYVPSLVYFAIRKLIQYPDQINLGPARIYYQRPRSVTEYDILSALIPGLTAPNASFSLTQVDPRLWAVIVQVFANLPKRLHTYPIPLSDKHLPLLQRVPCTPHFCLITVLDIPGCTQLTDHTISELKALHGLCALDVSFTQLSSLGVRRFSGTLLHDDADELRGPWRLRMLRLVSCKGVDNAVFDAIHAFPLLCVVDLQGTMCFPGASVSHGYSPASKKKLYHPTPILRSLKFLASEYDTLFSAPQTSLSTCHVTTLHHKPRIRPKDWRPPALSMQDVCVVFSPPASFVPATKAHPSFATTPTTSKPPIDTKTRVIDAFTVTQQTEMRDILRRDFLANPLRNQDARLNSLNRMAKRLQEHHHIYPVHDEMYWSDENESHVDGSEDYNEREYTKETENDSDDISTKQQDQEIDDPNQDHDHDGQSLEPSNNLISHPMDAISEQLVSFRSWFNSDVVSSTINDIRPLAAFPPSGHDTASRNTTSSFSTSDRSTSSAASDGEGATCVRSESTQASIAARAVQVESYLNTNTLNTRSTKRRRTSIHQPNVWNDQGVVSAAAAQHSSQFYSNNVRQTSHSDKLSLPSKAGFADGSVRKESSLALPESVLGSHSTAELPPRSPGKNDYQASHTQNTRRISFSPLPTESSDSSDIQNDAAETETSEHYAREAARAFYSNPSFENRTHPPARRTLRSTQIRDESLMLYRDPPAWNVLDTGKPTRIHIKERTHEAAILNKSNPAATQSLQALTEMINRKRLFKAREQSTEAIEVPETRNPFRVKSNVSISSLRPISALTVPVLPRENTAAAKKICPSDTSKQERKRLSSMRITAEQASLDSRLVKRGVRISEELRFSSKDGKAPKRISLGNQQTKPPQTAEASKPREPSGSEKGRGNSTKTAFDWKAWSKK